MNHYYSTEDKHSYGWPSRGIQLAYDFYGLMQDFSGAKDININLHLEFDSTNYGYSNQPVYFFVRLLLGDVKGNNTALGDTLDYSDFTIEFDASGIETYTKYGLSSACWCKYGTDNIITPANYKPFTASGSIDINLSNIKVLRNTDFRERCQDDYDWSMSSSTPDYEVSPTEMMNIGEAFKNGKVRAIQLLPIGDEEGMSQGCARLTKAELYGAYLSKN